MTIKIENTDITIRPSAVDGFYQCAYQWGKVFLEGVTTIPNARAAIGTSIHAAAEVLWNDAIKSGTVDTNITKLNDAAIDAWKEESANGMQFDDGEDAGTALKEIMAGTAAFIDDIVPFTAIPEAVEQRYTVDISHQIVKAVSGTVDYIGHGVIADIKTSRRKPSPANYATQQSVYKFLAQANGVTVNENHIHGVVLGKREVAGTALDMTNLIDTDKAKYLVNTILDTLDILAEDKIAPELILRPNPKYYLCSKKYCSLYGSCPATTTKSKPTKVAVKL